MPLINPSRPEQTVEQAADELVQQMTSLYSRIVRDFANTANRGFWQHGKYTPTEIAAALGSRGISVFQASSILEQTLETLSEQDIVVADPAYSITPNMETGVVAVELIPVPEPESESSETSGTVESSNEEVV